MKKVAKARYRLIAEGQIIQVIDKKWFNQLIKEIREFMPKHKKSVVAGHVMCYALLAEWRLAPEYIYCCHQYENSYKFMVRLAKKVAKHPDAIERWKRWNLTALGQITNESDAE